MAAVARSRMRSLSTERSWRRLCSISERAVQMSVFVVHAFVRLREMLAANRHLARKIDELENHLDTNDSLILDILATIKEMMIPKRRRGARIGFQLPPGSVNIQNPALKLRRQS